MTQPFDAALAAFSPGLPLAVACRSAIVDALTDDQDTAAALDEVVQAMLGTVT